LTSQLPLRLDGGQPFEKDILDIVRDSLATISGVFQLDPVPHLMRGYVPEQDSVLRRTGENLSATVATLKREDPERFGQLVGIVKELPENDIRGVDVGKGGYGDVMIALKERRGRNTEVIPARQMSDGMLRMLSIATALLSGGQSLAVEPTLDGLDHPPVCLVLEELENGLHPSQAARVLALVRQAASERDLQVVMTTHSPALLNALHGDDHLGVLVCEREKSSGRSIVRHLTELPGYVAMMARSQLGDAATGGALTTASQERPGIDVRAALGIG
jgi:predicted ATPase